MKIQNECYTYFKIVGKFDPDDVTQLLGIQPFESWKIGDLRANGSKFDFASWKTGLCKEYDVYVENQMRKTLEALREKIDLLNRIREENDVAFYLEVVPTVYPVESTPCLAPTLDIIDFFHATRTQIDIDLYVRDTPILSKIFRKKVRILQPE